MIDPHVHMRDWNQEAKETVYHGMQQAAAVGIRALFDMPNTDPPLTLRSVLEARLALGAKVVSRIREEMGIDMYYGVYGGLTANKEQLRQMVRAWRELFPRVVGLKLFAGHSTGAMGLTAVEERKCVYAVLSEEGYSGVLAVHCEREDLLRPELWDSRHPESHSKARPPEAEVESVEEQILFAREAGFQGTLHICHISLPESLACIEAYRSQVPFRITCGITPHHLLLSQEVSGQEGNKLKMNPPLRSAAAQQALFQAVLEGRIDWLESDHAPHTFADKLAGASGIPGFSGNVIAAQALSKAGMSDDALALLLGGRAVSVFGLEQELDGVDVSAFLKLVHNDELLQEKLLQLSREYPLDPWLQAVKEL